LVPGADRLISIEVDLNHFLAADAVVELVFQSQEYLPRFDIDHLAAGGINGTAIDAERDPSRLIAYCDGAGLADFILTDIKNMDGFIERIRKPDFLLSRCKRNSMARASMPFYRARMKSFYFHMRNFFTCMEIPDFKTQEAVGINKTAVLPGIDGKRPDMIEKRAYFPAKSSGFTPRTKPSKPYPVGW